MRSQLRDKVGILKEKPGALRGKSPQRSHSQQGATPAPVCGFSTPRSNCKAVLVHYFCMNITPKLSSLRCQTLTISFTFSGLGARETQLGGSGGRGLPRRCCQGVSWGCGHPLLPWIRRSQPTHSVPVGISLPRHVGLLAGWRAPDSSE